MSLTEEEATAVADALHGTTWQSGGEIWLVMVPNSWGELIVISGDAICVYADEKALAEGDATQSFLLS